VKKRRRIAYDMMLGLSIERKGIYKITDRYNQKGRGYLWEVAGMRQLSTYGKPIC
jgi:hypothetical protein